MKEIEEIKEVEKALKHIVEECSKRGIKEKLIAYEFLCTAYKLQKHGVNFQKFKIMKTEAIDTLMIAMEDRYSELEGEYLCVLVAKLGASQKAIDTMVELLLSTGRRSVATDLARVGASQEAIDAIVNSCIKDNDCVYAIIAARIGASQKVKDSLMEYFLEKKDFESAGDILELGISKHLVDSLVKQYAKEGKCLYVTETGELKMVYRLC